MRTRVGLHGGDDGSRQSGSGAAGGCGLLQQGDAGKSGSGFWEASASARCISRIVGALQRCPAAWPRCQIAQPRRECAYITQRKTSARAKVEHSFQVIECRLGLAKVKFNGMHGECGAYAYEA